MKPFLSGVLTGVVLLAALAAGGLYFWLGQSNLPAGEAAPIRAQGADLETPADVREHSKLFERRTLEVVPGVHLAVGYGLANVVVVEAPDGLIMVDTLESIRAAEQLLPWVDDLRQSTGKEITDVIFSHNHPDHVFGAGVFFHGPQGKRQEREPRIWAHEATEARVYEIVNILSPIIFQRAMRMFGVYLPDENFENNGIGPRLVNDHQDGLYFLPPTDVIGEVAEVEMAGERVILRHAPGETGDQLMIFLPGRSVLLPADNYYHAFPNLYTVRGTPYRDPRIWAESLDIMLGYDAEVMIPQHSLPVIGADEIKARLTTYRDAIQYVYDATIRMINAGMTPAEIAENIKLPEHLSSSPHLQEMYGRVEFAARAVFSGTLGWFSGDPADLRPVARKRQAELILRLAGDGESGRRAMLTEIEHAMADGEPAWALTLATHLSRLDEPPAQVQSLRAAALRALAEGETASSVRHYYLTSAAEAEGFEIPKSGLGGTPQEVIDRIPIGHFLRVLTVHVDDVRTRDLEIAYGFDFSDAPPVSIRIRRGVALLEDGLAADRAGTLRTSTSIFRGLAAGRLEPAKLLVRGDMFVDGNVADLRAFLGYFAPPG